MKSADLLTYTSADSEAGERTALTYYSDHFKQTIKWEVMFSVQYCSTCSSRTGDRGNLPHNHILAMNQVGNALSGKMTY